MCHRLPAIRRRRMPSAFGLAISGFAWSPRKSLRQIGWPMRSRHSTPTVAPSEHFAFESQAMVYWSVISRIAAVFVSSACQS